MLQFFVFKDPNNDTSTITFSQELTETLAATIDHLVGAMDYVTERIEQGGDRKPLSYEEWRQQAPTEFPDLIRSTSECYSYKSDLVTLLQNPVIDSIQEQTYSNITYIVSLFERFPQDNGPKQPTVLSLNEEQTEGAYCWRIV